MTDAAFTSASLAPLTAEVGIRLRSLLAIHTGRPGTVADDTVPRELGGGSDGPPVIPATAIKGAARAALTRYEHPFSAEAVALAFGDEGDPPGMVRFSAGRLHRQAATVTTVTNVALTAERTARPGRLRAIEAVEPWGRDEAGALTPLVFHTTVRADPVVGSAGLGIDPASRRERAERSLAVGLCGLAAVTGLGSRTSRGLGQVEVVIDPDAVADAAGRTLDRVVRAHVPDLDPPTSATEGGQRR